MKKFNIISWSIFLMLDVVILFAIHIQNMWIGIPAVLLFLLYHPLDDLMRCLYNNGNINKTTDYLITKHVVIVIINIPLFFAAAAIIDKPVIVLIMSSGIVLQFGIGLFSVDSVMSYAKKLNQSKKPIKNKHNPIRTFPHIPTTPLPPYVTPLSTKKKKEQPTEKPQTEVIMELKTEKQLNGHTYTICHQVVKTS